MPTSHSEAHLRVCAAAATDVGRVRQNNEDAFVCAPELGLFAVADGMGGHQGGEVAAELAISGLRRAITPEIGAAYLAEPSLENRRKLLATLAQTVNEINANIYQRGNADRSLHGMGCTLDVVVVRDRGLFLAHVGDSRVYGHLGSTLYQLTEDHNLGQALINSGALTAKQAELHPQGNQLMRALGIYPKVDVDTAYLDLAPGDSFLLCSDGVYGLLPSEKLNQALATGPQAAARSLIEAALDRGGSDNATAVVLQVAGDQNGEAVRIGSTEASQAMAKASLFAGFSDSELLRVQKIAMGRTVAVGEVVIRQDEPGTALFLVLDGTVSAWRDGFHMGIVGPGEPFGEMALHPTPYVATIRAETPTRLLVFPLTEVQPLLGTDMTIAAKLAMNSLSRVWDRFSKLTAIASRLHERSETKP